MGVDGFSSLKGEQKIIPQFDQRLTYKPFRISSPTIVFMSENGGVSAIASAK
jgi:hypothetical protein